MKESVDGSSTSSRIPSLVPIQSSMVTRRTVLKLSGIVAAISFAGCSGIGPGAKTKPIRLGAEAAGWRGLQPASIEETTNPTLKLTTGTTYDLTWENLDGETHELVVTNGGGTELASTDATKHKGATQTTAFTAEPEMIAYHDPYHPESMHGEIRVDSG